METQTESNFTVEEQDRYNNLLLGDLENASNEYFLNKYRIATSEINLTTIYNAFTTNKIKTGFANNGIYIYIYTITT